MAKMSTRRNSRSPQNDGAVERLRPIGSLLSGLELDAKR